MAGRRHVPLHLEAKHYREFTQSYDEEVALLLTDIGAGHGVELKVSIARLMSPRRRCRSITWSVPKRSMLFRNAVITDDGNRHIALTALAGMGGIGKTVLAQALCQDEVVQQAFPDGVIGSRWVRSLPTTWLRECARWVKR